MDDHARKRPREEAVVFGDLKRLCTSPGYVHALAHISFRENYVGLGGGMLTAEVLLPTYSLERLIRTEMNTLIGLMVREELDLEVPCQSDLQFYVEQTHLLLRELHEMLNQPLFNGLTPENTSQGLFNPFTIGQALREPIFYSGESAYDFQYRDLALERYAADARWIESNKGFAIRDAVEVARTIARLQPKKILKTLIGMRDQNPVSWTILPGFVVTRDEVITETGLGAETVDAILRALSLPEHSRNEQFTALSEFNEICATPLIPVAGSEFLLFHGYSLAEALYESPFYWMLSDSAYRTKHVQHRGNFTEEFAHKALSRVFGAGQVLRSVDIVQSRSVKMGEVDVLVLFGDRAIVLQAKSKRLTLASRKGNDGCIRDDFKKSVQDSYDQAFDCAELILRRQHKLVDKDGQEVVLPNHLREVYLLCLVSDHYPALSFQVRQFIRTRQHSDIAQPLVLDVFALDAMTEMLSTPLRLLSYVARRSNYGDRISANHELTILSYHLKQNLWMSAENDFAVLLDDLSVDLDIAMAARRDSVPGAATPPGILTKLQGTAVGRLVEHLESSSESAEIGLGFLLLELSSATLDSLEGYLQTMRSKEGRDRVAHDCTVVFSERSAGLTIHLTHLADGAAEAALADHCRRRKYIHKAAQWFGVCLDPVTSRVRFVRQYEFEWKQDLAEEVFIRIQRGAWPRQLLAKVGRNDPCPCGSGKKYKKCCGWR